MANMAVQVAASQQRQRIPDDWMMVFNEWTNSSLSSLADDAIAPLKGRAYAGWELDYRIAFDILVDDPAPPVNQGDGEITRILKQRRSQQPEQQEETDDRNILQPTDDRNILQPR